MSSRTFWHAVLAGLVLSAAGAVAFSALATLAGVHVAARLIVTGLGAASLGLLLCDPQARVGRLVCAIAWLGMTGALIAFDPQLWLWLGAQIGLCWLVRCLYRYDTLRAAAADALLTLLAVAAALAAARHAHSVFLALWTFFLVQATAALVPMEARGDGAATVPDDDFEAAHRAAEAALRRLATPPRPFNS